MTDPTARRAIEESLLNLNGPEHRRQRGLIAKEFTPRAAERVRPISHDTAHHLLDELINRAECDVVGEFSWPYVTAGICDFVGFDIEDVDAISASIHQIATASESLGTRGPEFEAGLIRLLDFSTTALAARRGVCAFPAPMSPSRIRMSRVRQAACPAGGFSPMVVERPGDLQLQSGGCRRGLLERFERRIAGLPGGSGPAEYSGRLLPLTSLRAAPDLSLIHISEPTRPY